MKMIEKVARKINEDFASPSLKYENNKEFFDNVARAALEAMLEPTDEMYHIDAPDMPAGGSIEQIYTDMIQAALDEK